MGGRAVSSGPGRHQGESRESPQGKDPPDELEPGQARTATSRVIRSMAKQPVTILALVVIGLVVVAALVAPLSPYGEIEQDISNRLAAPSWEHPLGTDDLGRDTTTRLLYGARVALQAAIQSVMVAAVIGIPIGLWVGYKGGWWDRLIMRLVDVADSVPGMFLAFAVIAVLGRGMTNALIAVGLIFVASYIRLTRACVLVERQKEYVDAAKISGLRTSNILFKQLLPNTTSSLVIRTMVYSGRAILIEAALSFLGLGLDLSRASWGGMLADATSYGFSQPALMFAPGLSITMIVLALNLLGDGLRDALDPGSVRPSRAQSTPTPITTGAIPVSDPEPTSEHTMNEVLAVEGLTVEVELPSGDRVSVVDDVSLRIGAGEMVGLVGESGSGKTMTGLAIINLLPPAASVSSGSVLMGGRDLILLSRRDRNAIRGREIAMIFQDPMSALSPVHTVGVQLSQAIRNGQALDRKATKDRAVELLALVGIKSPRERLRDYPYQFSGGMAQRVGIAMAIANEPKLLIADEPTTALDVTVQEKILDLLADLQQRLGMSVLLISHDLGVVADTCQTAVVMYGGQVVERAPIEQVYMSPRHPYTEALLAGLPSRATDEEQELASIPGRVPPAWAWPEGCRFHPRCSYATEACTTEAVQLSEDVRCLYPLEIKGAQVGNDLGERTAHD